jgi:hypothetical protein
MWWRWQVLNVEFMLGLSVWFPNTSPKLWPY